MEETQVVLPCQRKERTVEEKQRSTIEDIAETMLELLDLDTYQRDEGRKRVIVVGLRKAYLAGVEIAAQGMMLAAALDAEEADTEPPPAVFIPVPTHEHEHPSPRDLIEATLDGATPR